MESKKSVFLALPAYIIAKILVLTPLPSIINFYLVNSTHLHLFDQNGLWQALTLKIDIFTSLRSAFNRDLSNQAYHVDNWKNEFWVISYFNTIIRENELRPKNRAQNPQTLSKNHFATKGNQKGNSNDEYICVQSDLPLYPLPVGNFKTAYFEVEVIKSSEPDAAFFIGGALEGYYGPVGHGRSSYGYSSAGSIYIECEISPEDDPATAELQYYSAHYYEVDEGLNPIRTDRKIRDGDTVGFGIDFAKNAVFFTKNGKLTYEAKGTFATHPQQLGIEPLRNLASLYAMLSLKNNMEVKVNTGSIPFDFDLIQYQQKIDPQPSWYMPRQVAPEPMRPYSKIILDHLTAIPDENSLELEFYYRNFTADYNPPADPSSIAPVIYALTYGKAPPGIDTINTGLILAYESWRKIITAKNVPILPFKPTSDIRTIVDRLTDEFELSFHPFGTPFKDKLNAILEIATTKLGPPTFDIIAGCVPHISTMTFCGNNAWRKYGIKLLAIHEYFRSDRPDNCSWLKHAAAGILTDGRNEWTTHNTPELIYDAAIGTLAECRIQLGMKTRVMQHHEQMIDNKHKELEKLKLVFGDDKELHRSYEELIVKLKKQIELAKKCDLFPEFKRQKEIELALNGTTGTLKKQPAALYGVYSLNISPNEFSTIDEYLREVASQNRKLLTHPLKRQYLEYLMQLTRDLPLDDNYRGNLEHKINRPMNAVFGIEMTLAFEEKQSEISKQEAIRYIQDEIDKLR